MQSVDLAAMRQLNVQAVLRTLFQHNAAMTMSAIVRSVALSRRTVALVLEELLGDGWVREVDPGLRSQLGRPPKSYEFCSDRATFGAISIDTHWIHVALVDASGTILGRAEHRIDDINDPDRCIHAASSSAREVFAHRLNTSSRIRGLSISVTGRVDEDGTVLDFPTAPAWTGLKPGVALEKILGIPSVVENDANLAAMGEQWLGASQELSTFVWLIAGVRLGAGLIVQKRLHRGLHGAAGQIIQVSSMGMRELETHPLGLLASPDPEEQQKAISIVQSATEGHGAALDAVETYLDLIEPILNVFAWTLAPDALVLGGDTDSTKFLVARLKERMRFAEVPPSKLEVSTLGHDAVLLGAARLARESDSDHRVLALRERHLIAG